MTTKEEANPKLAEKVIVDYLKAREVEPSKLIIQKFNEGARAIFLGEDHLSCESPKFCAGLVSEIKRAGVRRIALELPKFMQEYIDEYLATGEKPAIFSEKLPEPLVLDPMRLFSIISAARSEGIGIICFDSLHTHSEYYSPYEPGSNAKCDSTSGRRSADTNMARNIYDKLGEEKVLVYIGAVHARRNSRSIAAELGRLVDGKVYTIYLLTEESRYNLIMDEGLPVEAIFGENKRSKKPFAIDCTDLGISFDGIIFIPNKNHPTS